MADVTMPQLGETVTEGTITRWMKSVGEQVAQDEPLFEVSTDKVDSEVPAPATGVLSEILVPEGETVQVGERLAVIGDGAGASPTDQAPTAEEAAPTAEQIATPVPPMQDQRSAPETPDPRGPVAPPAAGSAGAPPATPPAPPQAPPPPQVQAPSPPTAPMASDGAPAGAAAPPPPPEGYISRAADAPGYATSGQAPAAGAPQGSGTGGDGLLLSPVVRRLLDENGISASEISGTGVGGRITREDVLREIDTRRGTAPAYAQAPPVQAPPPQAPPQPPQAQAPPQAPAAPQPPPPQAPPQPPPPPAAPQPPPAPAVSQAPVAQVPARPPAPAAQTAVLRAYGDRVVPFSNMRRRTAEHMVRSKATSPHAFIAYEVDFENVDRVRRRWSERFKAEEGFSLTYLPFVARATVEALREFPQLNASVVDDSLVVHQQINLGIAVDLNHEGLIVPVVHRAEEITLRGVARRIRDLADRARSRQLTADDIASGTFSITNDGPFGTYFTVPIINQPQVAILATDGIRRRPVVLTSSDGSESLAIHSVGMVGMSWDHRAVDGAYVSSFLRRLAEVLDTRDWTAEL